MVIAATHTVSHAFTNTCSHTHTSTPLISCLTVFSLWTNIQPWAIIKYYSLLSSFFSLSLFMLSIWPPYQNSAQSSFLGFSLSHVSCFLPLFFPSPPPVCAKGGYHLSSLSNKLKWLLFGWDFFLSWPSSSKNRHKQTPLQAQYRLGRWDDFCILKFVWFDYFGELGIFEYALDQGSCS